MNFASIAPLIIIVIIIAPYFYFAIRNTGQGKLTLKNPHNGHIREAPVGYSWTVFFFHLLPALFRRDWIGALIMFLWSILLLGWGTNLVFSFIYNKMYLKRLIKDGFLVERADRDIDQISASVGFSLPMLKEKKKLK